MKKFNLFIAIAAFTFIFTGNAKAFFNLTTVTVDNSEMIKVTVPENHNAAIFMTSEDGTLIHEDLIRPGSAFTKIYDVSQLEDGIYTFYSVVEYTKTVKEVKIQDSSVEIISKDVEYRPVFSMEDDNIFINFLNSGQEDLKLVIENNDRTFFESNEGRSVAFHKGINLSNLAPGSYYATLTAGGNTFAYNFTVN